VLVKHSHYRFAKHIHCFKTGGFADENMHINKTTGNSMCKHVNCGSAFLNQRKAKLVGDILNTTLHMRKLEVSKPPSGENDVEVHEATVAKWCNDGGQGGVGRLMTRWTEWRRRRNDGWGPQTRSKRWGSTPRVGYVYFPLTA
jgi:hypothetical protein